MRLKYNKIRKFQFGGISGGGSYSVPVINDIPKTYTGAGSLKTSMNDIFMPQKPQIDRNQFKPDLSEFFKDLKGKGHTNEVNQIQKMKEKLDSEMSQLSDLDILSGSNKFQRVVSGYGQLTSPGLINQLMNSKNRTDEAFKIATAKQNLSQMNIREGKVKVLQEGKLVELDPISAVKLYREGKVQIPTNSKLWQERDTNPNFSDDANLSQELTYGVNIDQVIDKWRKNFTALGKEEYGGKHSKAIDVVSRGIASGNTDLAQEIMSGSKHSDNYKQVKAALDMSKNAMSQEELDSLTGFALGRVLSLGIDPTPDNIETQMMAALVNLQQTKVDASNWSESSVGKVDITDLGKEKIKASGGGEQKTADIGFYEKAFNGIGNKKELVVGDKSKNTAGSKISTIGVDLGNTFNKDGKGENELTLLSNNNILRKQGAPLIAFNEGVTLSGKKLKTDDVVPLEDAVLTFALKDPQGNVVATYETAALAAKSNKQGYKVEPVIAMKVAVVDQGGEDMFGTSTYEKDIDNGYAEKIGDEAMKKRLAEAFNLVKKEGDSKVAGREAFKEGWLGIGQDDGIVSTVVYFPASETAIARDMDKNPTYIPKDVASLQSQVGNTVGNNFGQTNAQSNQTVTPKLRTPVQ